MGFSDFIRERKYLRNVTPATLLWYDTSFRWLPSESPTQEQLNDGVIRMREKGLKASGCNSAFRAINAYLKWSGSTLKVRPLKEPQFIPPTFTEAQVRKLVSWKPKGKYPRRLHLLERVS
jgi:integrase/recombinase XerD